MTSGPTALGNQVLEHNLGKREVDRLPVQAGERGDANEGTFELADVRRDLAGDELKNLRRCLKLLLGGLLAEDRDTGLEVGWLNVGRKSPGEPGAHAVFEAGQLLRRDVTGDDDLLVGGVQGVEGVEELFLSLHPALQELDVVDQQDVDVAVAALKSLGFVVADRVDEVVGELLGADIEHPSAGVQAARVVANRVQQVGLAQSGAAVDEQRVVRLGRGLGDGDRGGVGEAVARTDDEGVEGVLRVQA